SRQLSDLGARQLLGDADIVGALQVQPELGAGAEPMAEPKRGVAADRPLALNDLADAVGWHCKLAGKLRRGDTDLLELVGEDLAGVDGRTTHVCSPCQWW